MRKNLLLFLTLLFSAILASILPVCAVQNVKADIPTYTWEAEYRTIDYKNSIYPLLNYKGVTYFPMTWGYCRLLGLTSVWIDGEGLFIASWGTYGFASGDFEMPTYPATYNPKTVTATLPTYPIYVNGKKIDNDKEEYPLLNFRDVTYFPMTWRFAHEEFNWDIDWSAAEKRLSVHWQIAGDWSYRISPYEVGSEKAYLTKTVMHTVPTGVVHTADGIDFPEYTTQTYEKFYTLDYKSGEMKESEKRPSYDRWTYELPIGHLPDDLSIRTDITYTDENIPAPYTPFDAHAYVTVDGKDYLIGEGLAITDAARAGAYIFLNAKRYTGWKHWTNPNFELYRIDLASGTVERIDTRYENYRSMKLLGSTPDGTLYLKCQQGSSLYGGEGGVMEASAYHDGYYAMDPDSGTLRLLRRFVYTDGDIVTPDGQIYGIFDWKNKVERLY